MDARGRCLASELLGSPSGPVAVIAGTRVTMPYALTVIATNLTDELFRSSCPTLGEALLHAKQRMLQEPDKGDSRRAMLDAIAATVSPSVKEIAAERAEHVLMFNLIGDPLLRLRHPKPVPLKTAHVAHAGRRLTIEGMSPIAGEATLELVLRRDRIRGPRPVRSYYPDSNVALAAFDEVYQRANDRCLKSVSRGHARPVPRGDGRSRRGGRAVPRLRLHQRHRRHGGRLGGRRSPPVGPLECGNSLPLYAALRRYTARGQG